MNYPLIIKEIFSCQATLQDQDNNLIYLPVEKLPKDVQVGQTLNLQINFENQSQQNFLAKKILNELLSNKKIDA